MHLNGRRRMHMYYGCDQCSPEHDHNNAACCLLTTHCKLQTQFAISPNPKPNQQQAARRRPTTSGCLTGRANKCLSPVRSCCCCRCSRAANQRGAKCWRLHNWPIEPNNPQLTCRSTCKTLFLPHPRSSGATEHLGRCWGHLSCLVLSHRLLLELASGCDTSNMTCRAVSQLPTSRRLLLCCPVSWLVVVVVVALPSHHSSHTCHVANALLLRHRLPVRAAAKRLFTSLRWPWQCRQAGDPIHLLANWLTSRQAT